MTSKSQRWVVDSGILRKKSGEQESHELLVFGYGCKLFRDDEKAKLIDQGKHLIPWMGDNTLKIDRYDGRGALGDLRVYEPPTGGFDHRTILTEDEYKVEQACDEERYRSLYNNDAQESMYHEEEIKRLHQALDSEISYSQVGFSYDDEKKSGKYLQSPKQSEDLQEEDELFVPEPELEIPEDMIVPETQKLHAIITKTALFISQQGGQMEVLIKAKQGNNQQFSFLSIDGELHPYYKHILEAIKSGKYNPEKQPGKEEFDRDDQSEEDNELYLHPSLASSLKVEAAPSIPSINYKPSADCAYSMLVNKITGKPPSKNQQQIEQIPPPPVPPINFYHPIQQGFPGFSSPQQYTHGPVLYNSNGNAVSNLMPQLLHIGGSGIIQPPKKELTSLVPYGSTPHKPLSRPSFIVPPTDIQIIIDKMASYVAKNGRDFETIVKNKGDPRFSFLELSHQYHGYYAHKLTIYEGAVNPRVLTEEELLQKQELQQEKEKKLEELQKKQQRMEEVQKRVKMIQAKKKSEISARQNICKQITTVSFSIKKPKEGESSVMEKRSALPLEESDDETNFDIKKETNSKLDSPIPTEEVFSLIKTDRELIYPDKHVFDRKSVKHLQTHDDETSFVDLTDDIFEDCQKEICDKQIEDKLKNKIVLETREKLFASKEKQLQMERRKKAAVFLSQIQTPTIVKHDTLTTIKGEVPSFSSSAANIEIEELKVSTNSLMSRLKEADLNSKKVKQRSRSRSGSVSYSEKHKNRKKHKKKKSTHRSYRDSLSSPRFHKTKKNKKSSKHVHSSRSRSPHKHHTSYRHRKESSSSDSDSNSS